MKICQIAPFGGQPKWQKIGLKQYPETKWFVLMANTPSYGKDDFLKQAHELKDELEEAQKDYPPEFKIKISVINMTGFTEDYYELFSFIKNLFDHIIETGFQIHVNATSGLQLVQMVLYQVSLIHRTQIKSYFIYNKISNQHQLIWLQRELSENENVLINLLLSTNTISLTDLQTKFELKMKKGKLPYIVKLLHDLVESGLVIENKEGRTKYVRLSEIGTKIAKKHQWRNEIKHQLIE